jgi:hypothetical protein
MAARETFDDFRLLAAEEVLQRAQEAEQRPGDVEHPPSSCDEGAWRRLYRDMRVARASTVAELKPKVVDEYAARLGYGYFRIRRGRRDTLMPFEGG